MSRESGGTTSAWYSSDRLGSVRGVLNNTGAVTASYDYDPYGAVETAALPADYGFTGEPQNTTYGLLQLRARWYGTSSGRFQTTDPYAGNPQQPMSLHGYLYGADDSVNNTDHTGLRLDDETRAAEGVTWNGQPLAAAPLHSASNTMQITRSWNQATSYPRASAAPWLRPEARTAPWPDLKMPPREEPETSILERMGNDLTNLVDCAWNGCGDEDPFSISLILAAMPEFPEGKGAAAVEDTALLGRTGRLLRLEGWAGKVGRPAIRGLVYAEDTTNPLRPFDLAAAEYITKRGDDIIGLGDRGVDKVLNMTNTERELGVIDPGKSALAADFLSATRSGRFNISEVKAVTTGPVDVDRSLLQIGNVYRHLTNQVPGTKIGTLEIIIPENARLATGWEVRGNLLVQSATTDGFGVITVPAELVRIDGYAVHVTRLP
ncbi:MAG TPA: RHS repeat-associated core domain-containing protein [Chloroflexia bacterium]|nr:RHS repeat-associated core domain-containing protein [Chloroflexia bacterium]